MRKIKALGILPLFPGFYGTVFEPREEPTLEYLRKKFNYNFQWDDVEWDYEDYNKEVGKNCCEVIQEYIRELGLSIDIEFDGIQSPREYNFTNDKVKTVIRISREDLRKMREMIEENAEMFSVWLEDNFKSRSGFISFHEHQIDVWLNKYLKADHNDLGMYVSWALDGLIRIVLEKQVLDLYYDIEYQEVPHTVKMAAVYSQKEMIADILAEEFVKRFGDYGYAAIVFRDAQLRAEMFGTDPYRELAEAEPGMIIEAMVPHTHIPQLAMDRIWSDYTDHDDPVAARDNAFPELEPFIIQN